MTIKQSMDLFGEALLAYTNGDRNTFYLINEDGEEHAYSLAKRFRPYSRLNKTERKLISLSKGEILDVGCAAGNVIPALEKRGKVTAIDISPKVIDVARQRGYDNCFTEDIFKYSPKHKFDTITLFGGNIGIGGTVNKTKKLLGVLKKLLKNDGQILSISKKCRSENYKEMTFTPMWKKKTGQTFKWLIPNIDLLATLCRELNLNIKIVSTNWKYVLVKITKK